MSEPLKVVQLSQTCTACPSQWEGRLSNGDYVYIRYRWGNLTIETGATPDEAVGGNLYVDEQLGDDFDGYIELPAVARASAGIFDFSSVRPPGSGETG